MFIFSRPRRISVGFFLMVVLINQLDLKKKKIEGFQTKARHGRLVEGFAEHWTLDARKKQETNESDQPCPSIIELLHKREVCCSLGTPYLGISFLFFLAS